VLVGVEAAVFESTDWTVAAGATVDGADGRVASAIVCKSLLPSNRDVANFETAAPAAKQAPAPTSINAAVNGPRLRGEAGVGLFILESGKGVPRSARADESSRFQ
jgi:hypothetical protein